MACCAGRHCGNQLADKVLLSVEIGVTGFALQIVGFGRVQLMSENELTVNRRELLVRRRIVARMTVHALLVQLFLMA